MKIAIIAEEYPPYIGGMANSIMRITRSLLSKSIEVIVITYDKVDSDNTLKYLDPYVKKEEKEGVVLYKIGPISKKNHLNKPGFMSGQLRNFYMLALDVLKQENVDLLQGFYIVKSGFFAVALSKELGIPSIVSVRGNDISRDVFNFDKFGVINWTLTNADFVTFVNDITFNLANNFFDLNAKSKIILNGCDFKYTPKEDKNDLKKKLGIKETDFIVGYCGTIREKKGVNYLLEAFRRLIKEYKDTHLLLLGDVIKDFEKKSYQEFIKKTGLADKVTITGLVPHEKVNDYYSLMDVLCVPSVDDGLCNTILEGLKCGKTIIVSDIFNKILDEKRVIFFKNRDINDLINKIKLVKNDTSMLDEKSNNTLNYVNKEFCPNKEAEDYIAVYNDLLYKKIFPKLKIEPTNLCNLNCFLCPTNNIMKRKRGNMEFQDFKYIIDKYGKHIKKINLWNFGEPFMNKDLFRMVNYAADKGIKVFVSTNSTKLNNESRKKILESKLNTLIVCLDGIEKEIHEKYRKGSCFEEIVDNIKRLTEEKRSAKSDLRILLQVLLTKDNEKEIEAIKNFSNELGVNGVIFKSLSLGSWTTNKEEVAKEWLPNDNKLTRYKNRKFDVKRSLKCPWARSNGTTLWNGDITTCCYDYDGENVFGNILNEPDILKSDKMAKIRERISKRDFPLCKRCQQTDFNIDL